MRRQQAKVRSYRNRVRRQRRSFSARPRPEAPAVSRFRVRILDPSVHPAVDPALKSGTHTGQPGVNALPLADPPASSGQDAQSCRDIQDQDPAEDQITRWAGVIGIIRNTSIRSGAPHRMVTNPRTPQITETGKQI